MFSKTEGWSNLKINKMPVFKIVLANPKHRNADGTYTVSIRMTHQRQSVFFPSGIRVVPKQIRKGELKDPYVLTKIGERILRLNREVLDLEKSPDCYTAKELKEYLLKRESLYTRVPLSGIDLFAFWENECLSKIKNPQTRSLYVTSLRKLRLFVKDKELKTKMINLNFLEDYERFLQKEGVGRRGVNLYMTHLKHVFNLAKEFYNDEDQGFIPIPNNPFSKYRIPHQPPPKRNGSLTLLQIRDLLQVQPQTKQAQMAKDCFFLSLFLAGINSADLYNAEKLTRDYQLEYNRTKTRNRRADQAVQKLHVPESVRPLFDKYRDPYQRRVFKFYRKYLNLKGFNHAINQGLKKLGKECGIPGLYYYQARHTFASLAHNDLKFSIEDVAKCLTHAPVMRVTIAYVKEDFSIVDEVNQAVVDYVLAF